MEFEYDSNEIYHEVASEQQSNFFSQYFSLRSSEKQMNEHDPNNNEGTNFQEEATDQQDLNQQLPQQPQNNSQQLFYYQQQKKIKQQQPISKTVPQQPQQQKEYKSFYQLFSKSQNQQPKEQHQQQQQQQQSKQQQQQYQQPLQQQPQQQQPQLQQQIQGEKKQSLSGGPFLKGERSLKKITDFAAPSDDEDDRFKKPPPKQMYEFQIEPYRTPYQEQMFQECKQQFEQRKEQLQQNKQNEKYMKLMANHLANVPQFAEAAVEATPSVDSKRKVTKKEMRKMLPPPPGKRQRRPKLYTTYFDDELDNERFYKNSESYFLNPARHQQFLNMNFVNREQHEQWDNMDVSTPDITISQRQAQIQYQHLQPQNKPFPASPFQQQQFAKYNPIIQQKSVQAEAQFLTQTQSQSQSINRSVTPQPQRFIPSQNSQLLQKPPVQQPQNSSQQQLPTTQPMQNSQQPQMVPPSPRLTIQNRQTQKPPQSDGPIAISDDEEADDEQPIFDFDDGEGDFDDDGEYLDIQQQEQQNDEENPNNDGVIQMQPIVQKRNELQQADAGRKTPGGKLTITYPDGSTRPFGKSFRQRGCEFGDPKKRQQYRREFVYFGGRTNGPTEYKLKKKEEEKQGLSRVNPSQFNIPMPLEENRYWIPIKQLSDIPSLFYMPDRFTTTSGVQLVTDQTIRTPFDAFKLFFDDELYRQILEHTKRKLNIQPAMLDAYFAAQIYSGMLQLKDDSLVSQRVSHILDRQNYEQIRRCLRVSSEKKDCKVRDFVNYLNGKYKMYYMPEEFLSVQASPETREYMVFDAVKLYTMDVKLLTDEQNDFEVALSLVDQYKGKNHKLVIDQFFSSPQLYSKLKQMKLGAVGTVKNEKTLLPQTEIRDPHFQKIYPPSRDYASYISIDNNNLLVYYIGQNEKECALMSSFMDISRNYQIPNSIANSYQLQPFVVNSMEKRNALIPKSKQGKWWRQAIDRLLETSIVNAAIILRSLHKEKTSKKGWMKSFRRTLIQQLCQRYREHIIQNNPSFKKRFEFKQHTIIDGELMVNCIECGVETKSMCQECTVAHDRLIGVCKLNDQDCVRFHNSWNLGKSGEQNFEYLKPNNLKGRKSTGATIKLLRIYKAQLESENGKINKGTKDYASAIQLLNETLNKLADQDPQLLISEELDELIQELQKMIPIATEPSVIKMEIARDKDGKKKNLIEIDDEPQNEGHQFFEQLKGKHELSQSQDAYRESQQRKILAYQVQQIQNNAQKQQQIQMTNNQKSNESNQNNNNQGEKVVKKMKIMGKTCSIINF